MSYCDEIDASCDVNSNVTILWQLLFVIDLDFLLLIFLLFLDIMDPILWVEEK